MSRVELKEDMLENVAGGNILYKWSDSRQAGILWINDDQDPSAGDVKYYFTDKKGVTEFLDNNHLRYGDYGVVDKLVESGLVTVYNG